MSIVPTYISFPCYLWTVIEAGLKHKSLCLLSKASYSLDPVHHTNFISPSSLLYSQCVGHLRSFLGCAKLSCYQQPLCLYVYRIALHLETHIADSHLYSLSLLKQKPQILYHIALVMFLIVLVPDEITRWDHLLVWLLIFHLSNRVQAPWYQRTCLSHSRLSHSAWIWADTQ
jgi:hypothetical protein